MNPNPIKYLRLSKKISRKHIARWAEPRISESAIRQVEDGMFANIPDTLHMYFGELIDDYDITTINIQYREFIRDKRRLVASGQTLKLRPVNKNSIGNKDHPFRYYLLYIKAGPTEFCMYTCMPKNSFFRYLGGEQRKMPKPLIDVLEECGMPEKDIVELDTLGRNYYDLMHGARTRPQ